MEEEKKKKKHLVFKRKKFRPFQIIGNLVIWLSPLVMTFLVGTKSKEAYANMSPLSKFYWWSIPIFFILWIIYWKKGKQWLHDKLLKNDIQGKAPNPLYVLLTGAMAIFPLALIYFLVNVLVDAKENIQNFIGALILLEAIGRLFLLVDSFSCLMPVIEEKKD